MRKSLIFVAVPLAFLILAAGPGSFGQTLSQTRVVGGTGGSPFVDSNVASGARVAEVRVYGGRYVDGLQFVYQLPDGSPLTGPRRGGDGGKLNTFKLEADEYITGFSGKYGDLIDSLRIHTNERTSPVYGGTGGTRDYRIEVPAGNTGVALLGRAGRYVDAIGLVYAPYYIQIAGQTGTAGSSGGSEFSDREIPPGARIAELRIHAGRYIDGIQAVYTLRDGSTLEGPLRGRRGGSPNVLKLEANEYITGISGRYGDYVDSLRVHTNRRTSRLYGGTTGKEYRFEVPAGNMAIGFFGREGRYMDAIGLNYVSTRQMQNQDRRWFRRQRQ